MNNELYASYMNIDTQERVRVTWRVTLTMPASIDGYIDVVATTQEEAAQLALGMPWTDVEWDDDTLSFDKHGLDLFDVECEAPPVDAILVCPGRKTGASLNAFFETETQTKTAEEPSQPKANDGGEPCK